MTEQEEHIEAVSQRLIDVKARVLARQKHLTDKGGEIVDGVDALRETVCTAYKGGFCEFMDLGKVDLVADDLEARAKDYCGEGEE